MSDLLRNFRLVVYVRGQRGLIAGGAAAMLAAVLAKLAEPWPLKFVIDHVVPVGSGAGAGLPALSVLDPMTLLTGAAIGLVLAIGLGAMFE